MPKITKHAEFLDTIRAMVSKEAEMPTATGKPGADTHPTSTSEATEHVDKNKEGHPEHNPQEFKQEPSKDKSDPTKGHKKAEETTPETDKEAALKGTPKAALPDTGKAPEAAEAPNKVEQKKAEEATPETSNLKLAELGKELLAAVKQAMEEEKTKGGEAPKATGKPGADTHYTSTSVATEHVDKNKEGHPEHNPQEFKQEPSKDKSDPTKGHKKAEEISQEELDKQASYELGRQCLSELVRTKAASAQFDMYKEAGRRDFETLIAQAAAELDKEAKVTHTKQASENDQALEKQAEDAGAQAFHSMLKQAQFEYQQQQAQQQALQIKAAFETQLAEVQQKQAAAEKLAKEANEKLAAKEMELSKKAEDEKRAQEFHTWGNYIVNEVLSRIEREAK